MVNPVAASVPGEATRPRPFVLLLPEQFIEIHLGELTEDVLRGLARQVAGVFGISELDLGAVASAVTLGSVGAAAAAGGASHLSAGLFRSPDDERPVMVLVSCYVMVSDHTAVQAAVSGLLEIHETQNRGVVRAVQLDSGPAVTVEARETVQITMGEQAPEIYDITQHTVTAWIPDPTGTCVVAVSVSSTNSDDWEHVQDLAGGIFDGFLWARLEHGSGHGA
jgi:hypothetical protein